jgi:DNA-binding IclR family transcriptional regulator
LEPFPEDVRQFLQSSIASVEQLEILRVLGEVPTREWSDDEIRGQAQVSTESIHIHLQALQERGLLRCGRDGERIYYQYGPQSAELEEKVRQMLELYRQRPVTMIRMVYEQPATSLRNFANSFRFRKEG